MSEFLIQGTFIRLPALGSLEILSDHLIGQSTTKICTLV